MRKIFILVAIIALAAVMSGCCSCCSFSTGMAKSQFILDGNTYKKWDVSLTNGGKLSYDVSAAADQVEVLIMDEPNFNLFRENNYDYKALMDTRDDAVSGNFPAPAEGTYYFVVYNAGNSTNTVTCSLNW